MGEIQEICIRHPVWDLWNKRAAWELMERIHAVKHFKVDRLRILLRSSVCNRFLRRREVVVVGLEMDVGRVCDVNRR